ncbi:MAG: hypothetical protein A3F12_00670 [Gammaproteobacteria bacterium RIFCSPHIGHO2_12_FULL_38_14]|nr:MAG: hypothetical protein A3F12_00670 [Gammaproteobacteria bacterium RIFCSPHIGHO2_12_FULL_38_14]
MEICTNLALTNFTHYYLIKNEYGMYPEILEKFKNFLDNFLQKKFLGYIDLSQIHNSLDLHIKIIMTFPFASVSKNLDDSTILAVLWDDQTWGKLETFSIMLKNNLLTGNSFSIDNFRELTGITRGKNNYNCKEIGKYRIQRMLSYGIIFNKIPIFVKKEADFYNNFVYGYHKGDYARNITRFDIFFRLKIGKVLKQLSDDKSKEAFKLILLGKPQDIWKYYFNNIKNSPQYLDYISINSESIILNCGVEAGFEIPAFLILGSKKIYNIDPCGDRKLGAYAKTYHNHYKNNLEYIEKWLYQKPDENSNADITSLSDIIKEYGISKIDLIKSDVEGAERDMVPDLLDIATHQRPQLAISIYHPQEREKYKSPLIDFVEIPLKLMRGLKNYKFYIGFYSYARWEAILYCIPQEIENQQMIKNGAL